MCRGPLSAPGSCWSDWFMIWLVGRRSVGKPSTSSPACQRLNVRHPAVLTALGGLLFIGLGAGCSDPTLSAEYQ